MPFQKDLGGYQLSFGPHVLDAERNIALEATTKDMPLGHRYVMIFSDERLVFGFDVQEEGIADQKRFIGNASLSFVLEEYRQHKRAFREFKSEQEFIDMLQDAYRLITIDATDEAHGWTAVLRLS